MQQNVHSEQGIIATESGLGFALLHLRDYTEARRWFHSSIERARVVAHRRRLAEALIGLGLVESASGQPSAARSYLAEAVAVAEMSECPENLAAGLAALARVERQEGDIAAALSHAARAVRVAQESALPVCEMWGEAEMGLALLAQGDPAGALPHTMQAAALVPRAHEGWIGTEEVHRAQACVQRALGFVDAADEQNRLAEAIVASKAGYIPDLEQRRRYLQAAREMRVA